jgi:hypothetical protein
MAAHRYWRITFTRWRYNGVVGSSGDIRVAEWQLFTAAAVRWPTSDMTGPSTPSPFVASASDDDGSRPAYRAFDSDTSDGARWISSTAGSSHWLQIDLGSAVDIASMKLAPDGAGATYHPVDFTVEASDTGAFSGEQVVILAQVDALTGWSANTLRTFSFAFIAGTVLDSAGAPSARTVRAYNRSTGALVSQTTSSSVDGSYRLPIDTTDPLTVICLGSGSGENALVFDYVQAAETDPLFSSVALLLHLNSTFADSSPAARTATTVNNVSIASNGAMLGGAAATSSTTPGQLLFASSADFATDGNWTLEFNIRCTTFSGGPFFMAQSAVRYFNLSGTGELQPVNWSGGSAQLTLNTRHHVAISHQADGTTRLFLDGALLDTSSNAGASGAAAFDVFGVPGRTDLPSFNQGAIDEVRWTKACRYTAAFTPPAAEYPNA